MRTRLVFLGAGWCGLELRAAGGAARCALRPAQRGLPGANRSGKGAAARRGKYSSGANKNGCSSLIY